MWSNCFTFFPSRTIFGRLMGNLANLLTFEPIFSPSKMTEEISKNKKNIFKVNYIYILKKIFFLRQINYFLAVNRSIYLLI